MTFRFFPLIVTLILPVSLWAEEPKSMQECLDQVNEKLSERYDQIQKEVQEELKQCRAKHKNDNKQLMACHSKMNKERVRRNHATTPGYDKEKMDCVARFRRRP